MRFLKFAVVCVAALAICGCEQGQPTPPAPTPDKQATTAVSAPDFAATKQDAESGDAEAQFRLGGLYDTGRGVPQDDAEAMKWYRLAADQGHAMAQHNLGGMYHLGQGVPQDYAEVMKWYRLAADQGLAEAQYNVGLMYGKGEAVPQDFAEAYAWLSVAAAGGDADAVELLDPLASELTPEQLSQGQDRATALLEKISGGK